MTKDDFSPCKINGSKEISLPASDADDVVLGGSIASLASSAAELGGARARTNGVGPLVS